MTEVALTDLPEAGSVLGQATSENFPVALRLLPAEARRDLLAVYGFARLVDDVGDELSGPPARRLAALDLVEAELERALLGEGTNPTLVAVARTVSERKLDPTHLSRLIQANRQDQEKSTYASFDELLSYCALSAEPVGRLVLGIFGESGEEKEACSDRICSGLQVVEHLQDIAEDYSHGRIYLPEEDLGRFGVATNSLGPRQGGGEVPAPFRRLMAYEVARARQLISAGARLVGLVEDGRVALAIAGFAGGGLAQLEAIERAGYDVLGRSVKASPSAIGRQALVLLRVHRLGRRRREAMAA